MTANSLSFSNIENYSSYDATSVALSAGTKFGEETGTTSTGTKYTNNVNWRENTNFSPSLPQQDKGEDSSTTYATLSAGNINIGGKDTTVAELGIHSDINTANLKVDDFPDLQALLEKQKIIADATSTVIAAGCTYSQDQVKAAEEKTKEIEKELHSQLSPEEQNRIEGYSLDNKEKY